MAKKTLEEIVATEKECVESALEKAREALRAGDLDEYAKCMVALKKAVDEYNDGLCKIDYNKFMQTDTPLITAIKQFYIETYRVKEKRDKDDGTVDGVDLEARQSRVDLVKFCKYAEIDYKWAAKCYNLLDLLVLSKTDVYKMTPAQLSKHTYYFIANASRKKQGETPDSNTKIVKLLQEIVDDVIFVDNGNGQNAYKCNNHDIAFIHDAASRQDTKAKCTIAMVNQRQFLNLMMDVFAHCLGDAMYTVTSASKK